jgi:hypothetical protein
MPSMLYINASFLLSLSSAFNSRQAEDDDDLDLFGDETEEDKKAADERAAAAKASSKKKESMHNFHLGVLTYIVSYNHLDFM